MKISLREIKKFGIPTGRKFKIVLVVAKIYSKKALPICVSASGAPVLLPTLDIVSHLTFLPISWGENDCSVCFFLCFCPITSRSEHFLYIHSRSICFTLMAY